MMKDEFHSSIDEGYFLMKVVVVHFYQLLVVAVVQDLEVNKDLANRVVNKVLEEVNNNLIKANKVVANRDLEASKDLVARATAANQNASKDLAVDVAIKTTRETATIMDPTAIKDQTITILIREMDVSAITTETAITIIKTMTTAIKAETIIRVVTTIIRAVTKTVTVITIRVVIKVKAVVLMSLVAFAPNGWPKESATKTRNT